MLWLRALVFTIVAPYMIGVAVPRWIGGSQTVEGPFTLAGFALIAIGWAIYFLCLLRFLVAGGTPAIFFSKPFRFLIGEEPSKLVSTGPYRLSRNPMYVGVGFMIFGRAIVAHSGEVAIYGLLLWLMFHLVVVYLEEPHLLKERGPSYADYRRQVPRWIGIPKRWRRIRP